jgi:hypothetical protein
MNLIKMAVMQGQTMAHTSSAAEAVDKRCQSLSCCSVEIPELLRSAVQLWAAVELVRSDRIMGKTDGFWPKRRLQEVELLLKYCRQIPRFAVRGKSRKEYMFLGGGARTGSSEEVLIGKDRQLKLRECGVTLSFSWIQDGYSSINKGLKTIHEMKGAGRHYVDVTSRPGETAECDGQGKA